MRLRQPKPTFLWGSVADDGKLDAIAELRTDDKGYLVNRRGRGGLGQPGMLGDKMAHLGSLIEPQQNGCWLWMGDPNDRGYGPYRTIYQVLAGPLPRRPNVLHHSCFDKMCVNPDHLVPMSSSDHLAMHAEIRKTLSA